MTSATEDLNENFNFFTEQDLHQYTGKWVAIIKKKIVGSGDNLGKLMNELQNKYPDEEPFIARAPTEKALIL